MPIDNQGNFYIGSPGSAIRIDPATGKATYNVGGTSTPIVGNNRRSGTADSMARDASATTGAGTPGLDLSGLDLGDMGQFGNPLYSPELTDAFKAAGRAAGITDLNTYVQQRYAAMAGNQPQSSPKGSGKKKKNPLQDSLMAYAKTLLSSADAGNATVNSQYDAVLAELLAQKGSADTAVNTGTTSAVDALKALVNPYANMQLASTQNAVNPLAAYQAALGYGPDNQTNALADLLTSQNQQANNANFNTGTLASSGWDTINQAQQIQAGARGSDALTANESARRLAALGAMGTRDTALNANATTRQTGIDTLMTQLLTLAASGKINVSSIIELLGGDKKKDGKKESGKKKGGKK